MIKIISPIHCIVSLLVLISHAASAQNIVAPPDGINNQSYFVKLAQKRFQNITNQAATVQANEAATISYLELKSDSTLKATQLDSADYLNHLRYQRYYTDSMAALIKTLQGQINNITGVKKNFASINTAVSLLDAETSTKMEERRQVLARVGRQIDSAGLRGEKGKLKTMLNNASAQQAKEAVKVVAINGAKDSLVQSGNIDVNTSKSLDNRLQRYQHRIDSINQEIAVLKNKLESPTEFRRDFKLIKARVVLIDSVVNKGAAAREYVFSMIDEGLRNSKANLFSLAAFFGAGGYIIPKEKYALARQYFSPVVDSLIKFCNKYNAVVRISSVAVNGYADASAIAPGSPLFGKIALYLKSKRPSKQELNAGLSAMRAGDLSQLLMQMIKDKSTEFYSPDKIVFESLEAGMGEQLPDPAIKNYKTNDERRRIVIIYWSVLPAE